MEVKQLMFYIMLSSCEGHCKINEVSIKEFFSKCEQIYSILWIWSHLLKKSLIEKFIFCAVEGKKRKGINQHPWPTKIQGRICHICSFSNELDKMRTEICIIC